MFKNMMFIFAFLLIYLNPINCSKDYAANEIASYMDDYLNKNKLKEYYMAIDPDHFLEEMKYNIITKYLENLKKKYNLNILVIIAKRLKYYDNSSFIEELYKEVAKPKKLKNKKSLIIIITTDDNNLQMYATEKFKPIFPEVVINKIINEIKPKFKKDDWHSNIFDLLTKINILHQQYNFNITITDL